MRLTRLLTAALCCAIFTTVFAFAQGTRGTIRGQVTDPNGAAVVGATVRLVDIAKQQEIRNVQTDESGTYQFAEIEPATYDVVISASGFTESRLREAKVEPNRNLQLDAALSVGSASAEVTVTGTQEILDRETATLGTTVDSRRVVDLPLNGRNVFDLAGLQPGVIPTSNQDAGFGNGIGYRVNGARGVENNITLDGANNNEIAVGGAAGAQPRPDAVQEFRLLTSNFEAEFGRNAGSIINVVTKSGTNEFHGNVRFFYRPTVLSAARYFDKNDPTDRPRPGTLDDFRRRFERKEGGGQIGGPIYLPRFGEGGPVTYSGKNRSYFFADYERRGQLIGDTRTISDLPTPAERNGDFSGLTNPNGTPRIIFDPATGQPFPGNRIPTSRFSPIALYYLPFLPVPGPTGQATAGADQVQNRDYFTSRVDHQLTQAQILNFTFNYFKSSTLDPFPFNGPPNGASVPGFASLDLRKTYNYVLRHTYAITPTLVNSFLAGYARNNQPSLSPQNSTSPAEIGFTSNFVANQTFAGPPYIRLFDRGIAVGNTFQGPQARVTENFQIQDSVSYITGNHRFKFGFDGTKYEADQTFLFVNQAIIQFTRTLGGNTTGDDLADFLLGNSPGTIQFGANGDRDFRQFAGALFAQDSWRVSDSLTLSLGLRYEYNDPLKDKFNRVAYYRPGTVSQLLTSGQLRSFEGVPITVPAGQRAPVGLVFPGDPDPVLGGTVPAGGVRRDLNNFAPRVGLAYSPSVSSGFARTLLGERNTVIRTGFGVFYGAVIGDTTLQQLSAPGFNGTNSFFNEVGGLLTNPFGPDPFPNYNYNSVAGGTPPAGTVGLQQQIQNPFAANQLFIGVSQNTTPVAGPLRLTQFARAIDPNIRTPYTYQYNFTVERGFLDDYVASVGFVGSRGVKLYALQQLNPAVGTLLPNTTGRTLPAATVAGTNINARRVNTDFGLGISEAISAGNSIYNSLQANLQKRFRDDGLLFQAAYTFSKSINDADNLRGELDLIDRRFGRSLSNEDIPHRFVGSVLYDLPFFKSSGGFAQKLLGGFTLGGIATFQSGRPITVPNVNNTTGSGGGILSNADLGAPFQNIDPRSNQDRAFNADAFRNFGDPATGFVLASGARRGTSGFNQFRVKNGINNFDLILIKRTRFTEATNLELRLEAFNAFNHAQFGPLPGVADATANTGGVNLNLNAIVRNPDGSIDPNRSAFGKFVSTREARVVQLGARFSF